MKKNILLLTCVCTLIVGCYSFLKIKPNKKQTENTEKTSEALEALRMLNDSRAYPYADIPEDAYGKAYLYYQTHFAKQRGKTRAAWDNIGPVGQGGRTISLAIDPIDTAKLWLGSASGGLWKSTTGGVGNNAWTYVPTGFPVLGVGSIAINPNNTNELFIGTGETYDYGSSVNGLIVRTTRGSNGIGILKSTDGGLTWSPSLNWLYAQRRGVWKILFNPLNTNVLYAATTEGVYKSTDHGITWNNILAVTMVMDLEIDKNDTSVLYAGVGNLSSPNKGLYKTQDAGANWNILQNGLPSNIQDGRINIEIYPANTNIVMATIFNAFSTIGVYRSTNKGSTWVDMNTPFTEIASYQGWYANCFMIKANDSSKVLAGGVELYKSTSSGSNLINTNANIWSDLHDVQSNPFDPNKIYVLTDIGLYRSNNFGQSFYECLGGYTVGQIYKGSVSATDSNILLIGMQDHNTFRFNGGTPNNWMPVLGGDGSFNAIDPTDDQIQYASYQYLNVMQSNDQGFTFNNQIYSPNASPIGPNSAAFIAPFVLCPSNPAVIYAGENAMLKSTDYGANWSNVGAVPLDNDNKIMSIAVSSLGTDSFYCTTAPENGPMHVYRSTNSGSTMSDISAGLPNRYPRDIEVNPKNCKEVYVAFSGFGAGHLFKSLNSGTTWTDISTTLPDIPFHSILVDPLYPDTLYAGSDMGVYRSNDQGITWTAMNSGLPNACMVFDLVYSPSDRSLLAFTFGSGAYRIHLDKVPVTHVGITSASMEMNSIHVFPNPAKEMTQLWIQSTKSSAISIQLLNMQGLPIQQIQHKELAVGINIIPYALSNVADGVYFIETIIDNKRQVYKLIIRK